MSEKIITSLMDYYSNIETELSNLLAMVNRLLNSFIVKYSEPIRDFLTTIQDDIDTIVRKGVVKQGASIVERINLIITTYMRVYIEQIEELKKLDIKLLTSNEITSTEIKTITTELNNLKALISSFIETTEFFLLFMKKNKLDIYTTNDSIFNNAIIQTFNIKNIEEDIGMKEVDIKKKKQEISHIRDKTVTQTEVTSTPIPVYSIHSIKDLTSEIETLTQEKEFLEQTIAEIMTNAVQLYNTKVAEERAAEERAAEERAAEGRAAEGRALEGRAAEVRAAEEKAMIAEERAKAAEKKAEDCELKLQSFPPPSPPPSPPSSLSLSPPPSPPPSPISSPTVTPRLRNFGDNSPIRISKKELDELLQKARADAMENSRNEIARLKVMSPEKALNEIARLKGMSLSNAKGGRINRKKKRHQGRRINGKTKRRQGRRINRKTVKGGTPLD